MPLRAYLVFLTLATLLPVVAFGGIVAYFLVAEHQETFRRGAEARTLAISTAVDAALNGSIATLQALATLPQLNERDLSAFRDRASRILATQPDWSNVNLALPSGQQIMNLQRPPGAPLPNIAELDRLWRQAVEARQPFVSDLVVGPVTGQWDYAVRVPVMRDGRIRYVLSAVIRPESMSRLLQAQQVPADWVAVVIDRSARIVARTVQPGASVGQLASQSLREGLARSPSGWFHGTTIEGTVVYTPYRRSEATGWAFAMGIPAYAMETAASRAALILGAGLLAAIALALGLAYLVSRRIATPIRSLASATDAMGRGRPFDLPRHIAIDEVRTLADAMRHSGEALMERQQLLEREKRALQAADRTKDEFLAMLGHELRNPLAALMAAAQVLRMSSSSREASASARLTIERQTAQMARLIEDLLDISRIRMGKVQLEREVLDLAQAASNVVAVWRAAGRLDGAQVALDVAPAWVDADRVRVEQIVSNLLDNALKFAPRGAPVAIRVRGEGGDAVLEVSDAGDGVSAEMLQGIFDLFVQGPREAHRRHGGLGLGLALVKRLAELHGGSVAVASEGPGRGATFTVRLPAVGQPAAHATMREPRRLRSRPRRILVIEDRDDARDMMRAVLALSGHEVRAAREGASGIAQAAELRPDVALVDIGLPDMDGYEVARRLRAAPGGARLVLIALTAYGGARNERQALDAGFDLHLTKPVEPQRLEAIIAALTEDRASGSGPDRSAVA